MKFFDHLLDLLFPPKCPFCHKLLPSRAALLCDHCQKELPWTEPSVREQKVEFTSGCIAPLHYQDDVRESIHRYKFSNCSGYYKVYGLLMSQAIQDTWTDVHFDAVTWVPLSKRRRRKRGYDQAMLLAQAISETLSLPMAATLVKVKHTPAQSKQADSRARKINVMDAYQVLPEAKTSGKIFLLCDDVATTGATLGECARMLRMAGAEKVYAATLARGKK